MGYDGGGGDRVRSIWPAEALAERGWEAEALTEAPLPGAFDVVVFHRPVLSTRLQDIRAQKAAGSVVLVQEDDDIGSVTQIGTFNPDTHKYLSPARLAQHDQSIREADGLIYTSDPLKAIYGQLNPRHWQIRNYLPRWVGTCQWGRSRSDLDVRVGWAGITDTHRHDLAWLRPAVPTMLRGATFTSVGDHRTGKELGVDGPIEQWPYVDDINQYYKRMSRADVGIVPLDPTQPLNISKSSLKAQEYAALGIPVVATKLPEQEWWVEHGVTGFLAESPEEFAGYVQQLIWDPWLRDEMAEAAKEKALANTIEERVTEWETALHEAASVSVKG